MNVLENYFQQQDTPAKDSPVGKTIVQLHVKRPDLTLAQAREEAHRLLDTAAGRKNYALPRVLTLAEEAEGKKRLREVFGRKSDALNMPVLPLSSHASNAQASV